MRERGEYEWGELPINKDILSLISHFKRRQAEETHRKLNYHTVPLPLGSRYFLFRRRSPRNSFVKSL